MLHQLLLQVLAGSSLFPALVYLLHVLFVQFVKAAPLKQRYGGQWAVVTGASSGIGASVAERLAQEGYNVVLIAYPNELLHNTEESLKSKFASREFIAIAVDLSQDKAGEHSYIEEIINKTKHINEIRLVFVNAGYVVSTQFQGEVQPQLKMIECLVGSTVKIAHHFYSRLVQDRRGGAMIFTASQTSFFPSPFVTLYAASKAFVAQFAAGLAGEAHVHGIDVFWINPGPVRTRFFNNIKADLVRYIGMNSPEQVADCMIAGVGRIPSREIGAYAYSTRAMVQYLGSHVFVYLNAFAQKYMSDYRDSYVPYRDENEDDEQYKLQVAKIPYKFSGFQYFFLVWLASAVITWFVCF